MSISLRHHTAKALRPTRLSLENLEDRTVPAVIDMGVRMRPPPSTTWSFSRPPPAANISADEFLRINSAKKVEQGYNSAGSPRSSTKSTPRTRSSACRPWCRSPPTASPTASSSSTWTRGAQPADLARRASASMCQLQHVYGYSAATKRLGGLAPGLATSAQLHPLDPRLSGGNDMADMLSTSRKTCSPPAATRNPLVYLYSKFGVAFGKQHWQRTLGPGRRRRPAAAGSPARRRQPLRQLSSATTTTTASRTATTSAWRARRWSSPARTFRRARGTSDSPYTNANGEYTFGALKEGNYRHSGNSALRLLVGPNTSGQSTDDDGPTTMSWATVLRNPPRRQKDRLRLQLRRALEDAPA